jgi:translation initiation factor IF-3
LDLVEVAATSSPPVCKILDYGKYVYTLKKDEKESRRNQKTAGLKEVKFSLKIGPHDYDMKVKHAKDFLEKGHKVKTTMFLRGREITRAELGFVIMKRVAADLEGFGVMEKNPNLEGKIISLMFSSKSGKTSPSKGRKEDGNKAEVKDK